MEGCELHRVIVLAGGEVRLREAGDGTLTGDLEGEGRGLKLDPSCPRHRLSKLGIEVAFQAVGAGGD